MEVRFNGCFKLHLWELFMMFFQMKLTKDKALRKFPFNLLYKTQLLFVEVGFPNGEVEN